MSLFNCSTMPDDEETFRLPAHLTTLDWTNPSHRRSVAAILVQGVYVMEHDRDKKRVGSQALAPPWWQAFHFDVYRPLTDNASSSIFEGAIFQLRTPIEASRAAPRCVVAFRGTSKLCEESFRRDLKLNLGIIRNRLHQTSCFRRAISAVHEAVNTFGKGNVWIAGHSLGAAVALLAGKEMAKRGVFIDDTFLFNSPFVSLPIYKAIRSRTKRFVFGAVTSIVKVGVALSLKLEDQGTFAALGNWQPHLFVNPGDIICSGYIEYFEHREAMEAAGGGELENRATQLSLVGLLLHAMGKEWRETMHLIPSAHLNVNHQPSGCTEAHHLWQFCREAHNLRQWWEADDRHMGTRTYLMQQSE